METPSLLENDASKLPALHLLVQMGYVPLTPTQARMERGERSSSVLLEGILRQQLVALNRINYRGRDHGFSDTNLSAAIVALRDLPVQNGFTHANKAFYDLVTLGKSFEQVIEGDRKSYSLNYVDWENPANNVYHVVPEFAVLRTERTDTYRPDLVLFVNGIPMGIIECKGPTVKEAIPKAIRQHLDYQKTDGIRSLYHYSNLLLSLAVNEARYATTETTPEFWAGWREQTPPDEQVRNMARLEALVNSPVATDHQGALRGCMNEASWQFYHNRLAGPVPLTEQDHLLFNLCRPERLLDLMLNYIVFDANVKKIARYQQYFTVGQTLKRVSRIDPATNKRAGGVIWHTQGSGKSLTMVMLAQLLAKHPDIPNPKILLVTDRVDLDDQLTDTFRKCQKAVVQATTGASEKIRRKLAADGTDEPQSTPTDEGRKPKRPPRDTSLLALLHEKSDDIVTTVINKFEVALKSSAEPVTSPNLFILVDEAHRTQHGTFHVSMRRLFPNACFLGFTGTPLMKREKNTAEKFGGLIEPAYTIRDAEADGAVVPLLYEGRHHKLEVNAGPINRYFDKVTEPLTDYGKSQAKRKFSGLEILNEADEVICARAWDIVEHFTQNIQGTNQKGQVVVSKKWQAVRYKKYIDDIGRLNEHRRVSCEVIISPPDVHEGDDTDDDGYDGAVRAFWKQQMDRHGNPDKYEKTLIGAFKKQEVPELLIVVDKLLTGFDAPANAVLYLTRQLKDHTLLQAIARVNRVFPGKDYGLIIDYYGNLGNLDQALNLYAGLKNFDPQDLQGALTSLSTKADELPQAHADLWAMFGSVANKRDAKAYQELLFDEEKRDDFYKHLSLYARLLKLALSSVVFMDKTPASDIDTYKQDAKFFINLRDMIRWRYSDQLDFAAYEPQLRKLIDKYITTEGDTLVVTPQFALLDADQRQTEMARLAGQAAQADHITSNTARSIDVSPHRDELVYRQLADMIQETIDAYHAQRLSEGDYLQKAIELEESFHNGRLEGTPDSLQQNPTAMAFYGVLKTLLTKADLTMPEIGSVSMALGIDQHIRSVIMENGRLLVDWQNNIDLAGRIAICLDDYLYEQGYDQGITMSGVLINELVDGCLNIAKIRYP